MNLKKTNSVLLGINIFLFLVASLVFIKVLFLDVEGFEWGSVSDWFSTASSVLTTYIAYRAYREAPKWINQKQNDAGFGIVTTLMAEYDQQVLNIQRIHFDILTMKSADEKFDSLIAQITKNIYTAFDLDNKLTTLSRWNIAFPQEVGNSFGRLSGYYNQAFGILIFRKTTGDTHPDLLISKLEKLKSQILLDHSNLKIEIRKTFTFPQ
ncbi:hypothetical protein ACE3KH_23300 [Enterobacter cloacae subsp. cloacae]|nr:MULTISPECIES: hypothetical protein [Enterobacter]EKV3412149.1 hypothetical protein [Klebsiella variicola]MBC4911685.1 hypothetical protein [Klebsiella pneumoniae]DAU96618.1 MAG TPA: hypothetical protein [Caudoviricetes sp.]MBC4936824.1 hypothetical protein [Klebsiella pneumoniae]MBT1787257.1 hypothetical protein [Enterobacter bugandensis]